MWRFLPLAILAITLLPPSAAAQREITLDLVWTQTPATHCVLDVADRTVEVPGVEAGLPVVEVPVPLVELALPGARAPLPGFFLQVGDDRVIDSPTRTVEIEPSTIRAGGSTLRYDPAQSRAVEVEGVLVCVIVPA